MDFAGAFWSMMDHQLVCWKGNRLIYLVVTRRCYSWHHYQTGRLKGEGRWYLFLSC